VEIVSYGGGGGSRWGGGLGGRGAEGWGAAPGGHGGLSQSMVSVIKTNQAN
jgi:hypothetical protein